MQLIIIRHGDPDYAKDSLTETGWQEAKMLADRISKLSVKEFYVSPLGRAKDTASLTLEKMNRSAIECDWLKEFWPRINRPDTNQRQTLAWDWLPEDWTKETDFFSRDKWFCPKVMEDALVKEAYDYVVESFDGVLAQNGYVRSGEYYKAVKPNRDTLVFFCHFGLECVLLSHLMNVSPMVLWHSLCAAPTSVTTVYTEERREGKVYFRASSFGDTSHLYVADMEPSFAARFCETYDSEERHD